MINSGASHNASVLTPPQNSPRQSEQVLAEADKANENKIENSKTASSEMKNPFVVFAVDFYSAISQKAVDLGKNLALAAESIGQNFNTEKPAAPVATSTPDTTLVSKPDISAKPLECNSDGYDFTNKAMLAKYIDNGVIFESNSGNRWPIASITKLMTAVIALEKTDPEKEITMSQAAVATEGFAGSLSAGEIFKEIDLIKAMLVASSNDAAAAIAENFEGGRQAFVDEMQKKASELKMFQTTYLEPTGLSFINQSTARDLSALMSYIYSEHPEILEISRQKEIQIIERNSGKLKKIFNVDHFAGESDFIGGKTGFIDESGRNLIAVFDISGRTIVTVVLGAGDSFEETAELKELVQKCL